MMMVHGDTVTEGGLLYLSREDVERLGLTIDEVVEAVDEAFARKGCGQAVLPPKVTMDGDAGSFAQVMPGWLREAGRGDGADPRVAGANESVSDVLGVKFVTVMPGNPGLGLPATNALIVLADPVTGRPAAVLEGGLLTALRTGAGVGVAARHLALPDVETVGVLGCGVQARTSVRALAAALPRLRQVRCFDISTAAMEAFVAEVPELLAGDRRARRADSAAVTISACAEAAAVCGGAGVVVSAISMTAGVAPPLDDGLLEEGALAVALDYDAAWTSAAMSGCDRFVTDDVPQTLATRAHGVRLEGIPAAIDADLGEVAAGRADGRASPTDRVFCLNLGVAVQDLTCAALAVERGTALGLGRRLPL